MLPDPPDISCKFGGARGRVHGFFVQDLMLKVLFALQMHIPTMNKKASNSENVVRDKPHPGKSGSEYHSARKENLLEDGGDMEPPTEGIEDIF